MEALGGDVCIAKGKIIVWILLMGKGIKTKRTLQREQRALMCALRATRLVASFLLHLREEDDIADTICASHKHNKAIDAKA